MAQITVTEEGSTLISCTITADKYPRIEFKIWEDEQERIIELDIPLSHATDELYYGVMRMNEWPGCEFDEFWVDPDQGCFCVTLKEGPTVKTEPINL